MIGNMSACAGMMKEFWRQVGDGSITKQMFVDFLQHKNPFAITDIRQEWQEFYRKYFRMDVDFSDIQIHEDYADFVRRILIPKGLTLNQVIKAIHKHFNISFGGYDINKIGNHGINESAVCNIRSTKLNYDIYIRGLVEADEKFKDISANQLKERGVNCITLLERLIYELKYWDETGQHLDLHTLTICAGSSLDGFVPNVGWCLAKDWLDVDSYDLDDSCDSARVREVVRS